MTKIIIPTSRESPIDSTAEKKAIGKKRFLECKMNSVDNSMLKLDLINNNNMVTGESQEWVILETSEYQDNKYVRPQKYSFGAHEG